MRFSQLKSPPARKPGWPRLAEHGSTLLQVTIIVAVLSLGVYFLADRLVRQKNVVLDTSTVMKVHYGLASIMDYTYYLIERRYCLTDNMLQAPNCELNLAEGGVYAANTTGLQNGKARSLERIMISTAQAKNMADMINLSCVDLHLEPPFQPLAAGAGAMGPRNCKNQGTPGQPLAPPYQFQSQVSQINLRVAAKSITPAHPLFMVIDPMQRAMKSDLEDPRTKAKFDLYFRVIIERDDTSAVPRSGSEVFFTVKVRLEDQDGNLLTINNKQLPLQLNSYGTMFARELGMFTLVVPHDFHMDLPPGTDPPIGGDVSVPVMSGWAGGAGSGMNFKSPVFVNNDVYLPHVETSQGGHFGGGGHAYSPVLFSDRLILGGGRVLETTPSGSRPYRPETAGGKTDMNWSDNRLFGGFKMGLGVDNALDKGLMQFASVADGAGDYSSMQQCLVRLNAQNDATSNAKATLYLAEIPSTPPPTGSTTEYVLGIVDPLKAAPSNLAAIPFNQQNAALDPPSNPTFAERDVPANKSGAVVKLNVQIGLQVSEVNMPLNSLASFHVTPPDTSATGPTALAYKALKDAATAETNPDGPAHHAKLAYETLAGDPAKAAKATFTVKVEPVNSHGNDQPHLVKVRIDIPHPEALYNHETGQLVAPVIDITGFDTRFYGNTVAGSGSDALVKTKRRLTFKSSTDFTPATPVITFSGPAHNEILGPDPADPAGNAYVSIPVTPNDLVNPYGDPNYDDTDYFSIAKTCEDQSQRGTSQSFGAASWNIDFSVDAKSTRKSWNFADGADANSYFHTQDPTKTFPPPPVGEVWCDGSNNEIAIPIDTSNPVYIAHANDPRYAKCQADFDATNSLLTPDNGWPAPGVKIPGHRMPFGKFSIVKDCIVHGGAQLVAGFFVCENLYIKPRPSPAAPSNARAHLYMIGTFVVKNLVFDSSALTAGVDWMSIYHPDAVRLMRDSGVLQPSNKPDVKCTDNITGRPIWDVAAPTVPQKQDQTSCNALVLRDSAQPFQWTSFDPDCGILPGTTGITNTTCKKHPVNYVVMEQGRGGGP